MSDESKKYGRVLRTIEASVDLARKVGKPLTFFAATGFALLALLPLLYWAAGSDGLDSGRGIALVAVAVAINVNIVCVLLWAKAKIKQDPHAFRDE